MSDDNKKYAKVIQLAVGVDLLGSRMSLSSDRGNVLEVTGVGVLAHSKKTNRSILIPYSNIKAVEMLPEFKDQTLESRKPGRPKLNQ